MPTNLVLDAQLSKDSYSVNNANSGVVNGWSRVVVNRYVLPNTVESGSNFAAQMYQGADGTYKIAFRGTENPLSQGDRAMNGGGIMGGNWTPEMQQAVDFTAKAIRQVADEKGIEFKEAAKLFTVTGHSQGGFEAELAAKMFGLAGSSQDGPGASRLISSAGYNAAKAAIQAQEPGAVLDGGMSDFVARQYTMAIGGLNEHIAGVAVSKSALPLVLSAGQGLTGGMGFLSSALMQATVFHKLDNIIAIEQARAANPWLQKIVQIDDAGDGAMGMASVVAGRWSAVQVAGGNVGISANDVQGVLKTFLQGREGQGVSVQENQKTFYVQASNGDTLILMPDGSGVSTVVQGIQVVQKEYAKGGVLSKTVQAQRDDDGNLLIQSIGSGYSFTAAEDVGGQLISSVYRTYDSQGQLNEKTVIQRQDNGVTLIKAYDKNDVIQSEIKHQTFDDGTAIEIKTENGQQSVRSILLKTDDSTETISTDWKNLATDQTQTSEQLAQAQTNALYSDMAGFITALRTKDKLNQALYGAKIIIDLQIKDGLPAGLEGMQTAIGGLSATVGVVAGLHALQSNDTRTQISGAVGLLSSANQLAAYYKVGNGAKAADGFLENGQLGVLNTMGALISISNLRNLDNMLDSGQVGSAAASVYAAWQAGSALYAAATGAGSFLSSMGAAASFNPAAAFFMVVGTYVLDDIFGDDDDPPPPPPFGNAHFTRAVGGELAVAYADTNDLGHSILKTKMEEIMLDLNKQVTTANASIADPDRHLVLIASRLPKVYLQSWPSYEGNGETNYYYYTEMIHPQTGQKYGMTASRQNLAGDFAGLALGPEAIAQQWQVKHMTAKFGADESKWQTEGQWATEQSAIEQQRTELGKAYKAAYEELKKLQENKLSINAAGDASDATSTSADTATYEASLTAAKAKLSAAQTAFTMFSTEHPLGFVNAKDEAQHNIEGINPQAAALIVDQFTANQLAALKTTDPEAWQAAWSKARESATQQWMKVISLDWNGDGVISKWMPAEIAAGSNTATNAAKKFNVGTSLKDLQGDGYARFDVDGDGYREATQWIASTDAILGIDRDGNGVLDAASELFNGPNTPYDQRGWASLKYYDSNNDSKITRQDAVFKLLRIWIDINGDGQAGNLETFNLDMDYVGVDMAKLKASLDSAGQIAMQALKQLSVGSIDLATLKFKLADGSQLQAFDDQLKADVLGTSVGVDAVTQNVSITRETRDGSLEGETWITFSYDMSELQELLKPGISATRKQELYDLAKKYKLDPDAPEFEQILKNLKVGGENVGGTGLPTSFGVDDVFLNDGVRTQIEAIRAGQARALQVLGQVMGDQLQQALQQPDTWKNFVGDMSELQELLQPSISAARKTELRHLAATYGLNPDATDFAQTINSLKLGGANMGGNGVTVRIGTQDVYIDNSMQSRFEALRTAQANAMRVLSVDVLSGALEVAPNKLPLWATTTTTSGTYQDGYVTARNVQANEVRSDIAPKPDTTANAERWVLPRDVFNLDFVVKGVQQGGLLQQKAVVVSQKINAQGQVETVAPHTVQVVTVTKTATKALSDANVQGEEGERLSLGYLQLEQDAREQLVREGGSPLNDLRMLGLREVRHGSVVLDDATGILRFVADPDYVGADAGFTYVLVDEGGLIYTRTVNMRLTEVNDAPVVLGETIATMEDIPITIDAATLLANDYDKEGDALQIIGIGRVGMGRATLEENGQIRYVPPTDLYGTTDTVEYLVRDARGAVSVGVIKITLASAQDAPTVRSELIRNAQEDVTLRIEAKLLLANDFDPDVDARVGAPALRISAVANGEHGSVFLDGLGDVIFVPEANFHGKASFVYTVADAMGLTTQGHAEIDISQANDGPVAVGEQVDGLEDQALTFDVSTLLVNDTDIDIARGEDQRLGLIMTKDVQGGTVERQSGKLIFTPTKDFNGTAGFSYVISDNAGGLAEAKVRINLAAVNDAPVVFDRQVSGEEDRAIKFKLSQLMQGVRDAEDGVNLTVSVAGAQHGQLIRAYDADAREEVVTFTPDKDYYGAAGFDYTVSDRQGGRSTAQVRIDLQSINDLPQALVRNFQMNEDSGQPLRIRTGQLLAGITDVEDGTKLTVSVSQAANGSVKKVYDAALKEDVYEFTPAADYNGLAGFMYQVSDTQGGTSQAAVQIQVVPVNDAPTFKTGSSIAKAGEEDQKLIISEAAIVSLFGDIDGDTLSLDPSTLRAAQAGDLVSWDAVKHEVVFTPQANAFGTRQIEAAVKDAAGAVSQTVRLDLKISEINDAPVVRSAQVSVYEDGDPSWGGQDVNTRKDSALNVSSFLALASDADGDRLQLTWVGNPSVAGAQVFYTPGSDSVLLRTPQHFNGPMQFSYTISDGRGGNVMQTAYVDVRSVNDLPVAPLRQFSMDEDSPTPLRIRTSQLLAGVNDVEDGNRLTVSTFDTTNGTLSRVWNATYGEYMYEFSPNKDYNGLAGFRYQVTDSQGGISHSAAVQITVNPTNDAPFFQADSYFTKSGEEDQDIRISETALLKLFGDIDNDALQIANFRAVQSAQGDTLRWDATAHELVFRAGKDQNGTRQIEVSVKDPTGALSDTARLNIEIKALNDAPVLSRVYFEIGEDGLQKWVNQNGRMVEQHTGMYDSLPIMIDVARLIGIDANGKKLATDAENDTLSVINVGNFRLNSANSISSQSKVSLDTAGKFITLNLPQNYNGLMTFEYTVSDGHGGQTTATAQVNVVPIDDVPDVSIEEVSRFRSLISYRMNVTDVDDDVSKFSYSIDRYPLMGIEPRLGKTFPKISSIEDVWRSFSKIPVDAPANYFVLYTGSGSLSQVQNISFKITRPDGYSIVEGMSYVHRWDPIVLDIGNDGLEFTSAKNGIATFDVNGDGTKDRLAWVSAKDALLVYDYDQNNLITQFDELSFGSHLSTPNSDLPDLQALARPEFDTNQDGVLSAKDAKWNLFKVWQDKNSNGVVDAGELQTLDQAGVKSMQLHANVLNHAYNSDVTLRGFTRVQMTDGRELQAGDARFSVYDPSSDTTDSSTLTPGEVKNTTEEAYNAALSRWQLSHDAMLHAGSTQFTGALTAQKTWINAEYRYTLPTQLFADVPAGRSYNITQADGSDLPSWLHYDTATRTLSGTPAMHQQGLFSLKVSVPNSTGNAVLASGVFSLEVAEYNQAPMLYGDIGVQGALEGETFILNVAPNLFIDRDATDALQFTAKLRNGAALPSWLKFDPVNLRFAGTPGADDVGALEVQLIARDAAQASAIETFSIYVTGINDAPDLVYGLQAFGLRVGQDNSYVIPLNAFVDLDKTDSLSFSVHMADGSALPSWLRFDPITRTLSGVPQESDFNVTQMLRVTATDSSGASINTWLPLVRGQWGTAGNDNLLGSKVRDYIYGEAGNDTLSGGDGIDKLFGGQGDDTYRITAQDTQDQVLEQANEGVDNVLSEVTYALPDNVENLTLTGAAAINGTGNELNNVLVGNANNNTLTAGAGNDTLDGGAGADTLIGGVGDDTYVVDSAADLVIENADESIDNVRASVSYALNANVENLTLTGAAAINSTGNVLNNVLVGNAGNNVLDGGAGVDTLKGGLGDDTYVVDTTTDVIVENANEGVDTVQSSVGYTLGGNLENLTLTGAAAINGTGNELNNLIAGTAASNVLSGGAGNDTLKGDGGNDTLDGGEGQDWAQYAGQSGDYRVDRINGEWVVTDKNLSDGDDGRDVLRNVEGLRFANGQVDLGSKAESEFRVNSYTTGDQVNPSITVLIDGGFVVTWHSEGQDGSGKGIFAQRYNALGQTQGGEFRVNSYTAGNQSNSGISALEDGGFVVTWSSYGQDGYSTGTYAQCYNAQAQAQGAEFRVNNYTTDEQEIPSITALNDGGFVVTWSSYGQDGDSWGIFAQRYNTQGQPQGSEFRVNSYTTGGQWDSSITALSDGGFVVTWTSDGQDGSGYGIYGECYNAQGQPQGGEFRVNRNTTSNQVNANITALSNGGFVVTWDSDGQDGTGYDIYAQRYNAQGQVQGNEFRVNSYTPSEQGLANITALSDGGFVVTWSSYGLDGDGFGIYAQRYNAQGQALGGEFRINSYTTSHQAFASITALSDGGFVVTWTSNGQDGSGYGIYAQRYNEMGEPVSNFALGNSSADTLNVGLGYVAKGGDGDDAYIVNDLAAQIAEDVNQGTDTVSASVSWKLGDNFENLSLTGAAAINGTGNTLNNVLLGNTSNNVLDGGAGNDTLKGGLGDDTYVVDMTTDVIVENADEGVDTVQSSGGYTLSANLENLILTGVAAINATGNALNNVLVGNAGNNVLDGGAGIDTLTGGLGDDTYVVDATNDVIVENVNEGRDTVQSSVNYTLGANLESLTLTGVVAINGSGNELNNVLVGNAASNVLSGGTGNDTLKGNSGNDTLDGGEGQDLAQYAGQSEDYRVDRINGEWIVTDKNLSDGDDGRDVLRNIEGLRFANGQVELVRKVESEFRVNSYTADQQSQSSITALNDGGFVVTWASSGQDGNGSGIYAQRYNAQGQTQRLEFKVNTYSYFQYAPCITALNDGGFLVTWDSYRQDGDNHGVYAQRYNLQGQAQGGEFRVNSFTTGFQGHSRVTALGDGGFVVAWISGGGQDGDGSGVYAQCFNAQGQTQGAEFRVNSYTVDGQYLRDITALSDGGFVVNWMSHGQDGDVCGIYAQRYNAQGQTQGAEFRVNSYITGDQRHSTVTALSNGGFVVTWDSVGQDGSSYGVYGQRYNAQGQAQGGEFRVNSHTIGMQYKPCVAALSDGGFVVTWESYGQDDSNHGVYGQRYNAQGQTQGGEFRVNNYNASFQDQSSITALSDGGFVVTWTSVGQDGDSCDICAQRYNSMGEPVSNSDGNSLSNFVSNYAQGNSSADTLNVGLGFVAKGGDGDDVYIVSDLAAQIAEDVNQGKDSVISSVSWKLGNNFENLTLTGASAINGTGNALNNVLGGNAGNNVLDGGVGNDTLDGGGGIDTLKGGLGDDTYVVDTTTDVIVENVNEGRDTVQSSMNYTLGVNIENLILTGTAAINGTGNELNNTLSGNSAANILEGGSGNDSMSGGYGNDTYVFGRGYGQDYVSDYDTTLGNVDTVQLGAGISASDVVVTRVQNDLNLSIAGATDKLTLGSWFSGDAYRIEKVRFADGTVWDANALMAKSSINNSLVGTPGDNYLVGTTGADRLAGLAGNDTYVVDNAGDVIIENANEGADTVNASLSYTLTANVENLTLTGTAAVNGAGNELNNVLKGNSANNQLTGGLGNDTYIFGRGSGKDTLIEYDASLGNVDVVQLDASMLVSNTSVGRRNNDLYISTNTGADQLILSNWFAGREYQVEQLRFADGTVWDASALTAKATGADIDPLGTVATTSTMLVGGSTMGSIAIAADHDWYKVTLTAGVSYQFDQVKLLGENLDSYLRLRDANGVQLVFNDDSGGDYNSLFSYTPTQSGTYFIDAGGYNEKSVGKYLLSVIHREVGTANADVMAGTLGADQFEGGAGDDVYTINDVGDVVMEGLNAGLDQVNISVSHALTANVENLTLTGTAAINGTGNALNNVLVGNAGNNVLNGGDGNDTLTGGSGADSFVFDVRPSNINLDLLLDFSKTQGDVIALDDAVYILLKGDTDLSDNFRLSTKAAVGNNDWIVYNTTTGELAYDTSGNGAANSSVVFAVLNNKPQDLTGQQFVVI